MGTITILAQQKANDPPTVNAGIDQSINLPTTSVSLVAVAGDADGVIVSSQWTKLSGGTAIITSSTSLSTTVTDLQVGNYTFQIKVFDNNGASAIDTVNIAVGDFQTMAFRWVADPEGGHCEQVDGDNTGNYMYDNLKKVSDDADEFPLDVNNIRTSLSFHGQDTKGNNIGDLDYIAPFENLTDCPISNPTPARFRSYDTDLTTPRGVAAPAEGSGMPVVLKVSLDNQTTTHDTLPGIHKLAWGAITTTGRILDVQAGEGGVHDIQVGGTGELRMIQSSGNFIVAVDFKLDINGEIIDLSNPVEDSETGVTTQYIINSNDFPGGYDFSSIPMAFSIAFHETRNLLVGSYVNLYAEVRYVSNPELLSSDLTFYANTILVDITQL